MANIRVTELDFDTIKSNLKTFLQSQNEFTDYDFEGSNLSVLLDILAYNTHYNAVLANMVSNEMFIDTAIKRSSVASLAKHLRYTPRSIRSSSAKISISLQNVPGNPTLITLQPYTAFTTSADGESIVMYNKDGYTATPIAGVYTFDEVVLYQGRKLDYFWTVSPTDDYTTKYIIPNLNVDTDTLRVKVTYASGGSDVFTLQDDITEVTTTSKIYYLEENTEGFFQIHFGDGVLGYAPSSGDQISIDYLISDGEDGNVSTNVDIAWTFDAIAGEDAVDRSATTISKPSGGSSAESVEEVRFNAINRYSTQGRAVTITDYSSILQSEIAGAQSINVWGGENNNPPQYGKVFISIKPKTGYVLTENEKERIINDILVPRSMTVSHVFVDPTYTYLSFNIILRFNPNRTNKTAAELTAQANTLVTEFIDTNLERFNSPFYCSQLQADLMDMDVSILSANVDLTLQKRIEVTAGGSYTGSILWGGFPHPNDISSNYFAYTDINGNILTAQIRDVPNDSYLNHNGTGVLKLYNAANNDIILENIGTINYGTGEMSISNLDVTGYIGESSDIRIRAEVQSKDITPGYNEILVLDDTVADVVSNLVNGITIETLSVRT